MKTFYIVRHGNTFAPGSRPLRIGSRTDLPLTPEGQMQATALGRWFVSNGVDFAAALSGPLQRTRQTADLILAACPSPTLSLASWLDEIDHGPDEGRPESSVVKRVGQAALDRWDRLAEPPPGWQVDRGSRVEQCRRGVAALGDGPSLLVTSNGAARFVLLALGLALMPSSLRLRTGAFGQITDEDNQSRLVCWDVRPFESVGGV